MKFICSGCGEVIERDFRNKKLRMRSSMYAHCVKTGSKEKLTLAKKKENL